MRAMANPQLQLAGIGGRAYAFLVDWHIRLLAALALFCVGAYATGPDLDAIVDCWRTTLLPAALVYFLYHPVLEVALNGETPGKRWVHLRIVTTAGEPASTGAILMRNVLRLVDCLPAFYVLGLVLMFCTRDQLRPGDLATGTVVIYDEPPGAALRS